LASRRRIAVAAAFTAMAAATPWLPGMAQAEVLLTQAPNFAGEYNAIHYGQGAEVYELQPYLYVSGLGAADAAVSVAARSPWLDFSFSHSQPSPGLLVLHYRLNNLSASESFEQLRFMVYANPDGDTAVYADLAGEQWPATALAGNPDRRRSISLPTLEGIAAGFVLDNQLADAPPPAVCTGSGGCDLAWGLQWSTPLLGPGEQWQLQVGLSDDGSVLSSRWLTATALNSPDTVLHMSGNAVVSAVPEPAAWLLLSCGLIGLHLRQRRT
jgi:hypothetical protein